MKKIYNYILFKIHSTKLLVFIIIFLLYEFSLLVSTIYESRKYNIYDFLMENFSYLSLYYFIIIFFMVMIYNIFDKRNFYNYLSVKFSSRQEMYIANIVTALLFSVAFILCIDIIGILMGSFMSFDNSWSEYFFAINSNRANLNINEGTINLITKNLTPVSYLFITNIFIILYLFFISILFIVLNLIFKKRAISFISIIILNVINMGIDKSRFSFTNNIYLLNSTLSEISNGTYIISKLIYWIILIILVSTVGYIVVKRKDCSYGD